MPVKMYADSLSLFDIVMKATTVSDERLMFVLQFVEEKYQQKEVQDLMFMRSAYNLVDTITERKKYIFLVENIVCSKLLLPIKRNIER